nr:hypothetical protein Q903MT_gene2760 [Picea sitchensis]
MRYYVIDDGSFLCYAELSINQWVLRGHLCVRGRAPFFLDLANEGSISKGRHRTYLRSKGKLMPPQNSI